MADPSAWPRPFAQHTARARALFKRLVGRQAACIAVLVGQLNEMSLEHCLVAPTRARPIRESCLCLGKLDRLRTGCLPWHLGGHRCCRRHVFRLAHTERSPRKSSQTHASLPSPAVEPGPARPPSPTAPCHVVMWTFGARPCVRTSGARLPNWGWSAWACRRPLRRAFAWPSRRRGTVRPSLPASRPWLRQALAAGATAAWNRAR